MSNIEYIKGTVFAKKKGDKVQIFEGGSVSDESLVLATGSTTPRMLKDRFADVVNVKNFGAKGDGVTDDSAAIQAAIDSAENGETVFFPSGIYTFADVHINKPITMLSFSAVLRPQKNKFDISRVDEKIVVAKYKNMLLVEDVSFFRMRGFEVRGDYDPSWGYVNAYQEEAPDVSAEGNNLIVILNSSNVFIESVRLNRNIITIYRHADFYERCTSVIGHASLLVSGCSKVTLMGVYHVGNMCEEIEIFNCKEVKIFNTRAVSEYGHSMLTLDYCDGVDVVGSEFSISNLSNVNSTLNIHSRNVRVHGCAFVGGDNIDIGREDVYYHLIDGHNPELDVFKKFVVENIDVHDCYFFNLGVLSQMLVEADDTDFVDFMFMDKISVRDCRFEFDLDKLTDYTTTNAPVFKYVWWLNTHHGKFGSVSFVGNSINVQGSLKENRDYNDLRLFYVPSKYEHKELRIENNDIDVAFSNQPDNINVSTRDGWLSIGSSIDTLIVHGNKVTYPTGLTIRSATLDPLNKPKFNKILFTENVLSTLWGIRFDDYGDVGQLVTCGNNFSVYPWTGGLFQYEKTVGVNCLCFFKATNAKIESCAVDNNNCESACVFKVADSSDGVPTEGINFIIKNSAITNNKQMFKAVGQTATNTARGIVMKNIGSAKDSVCRMFGNYVACEKTTENNRIYNFDTSVCKDNIFSVGGLFTECTFQGKIQLIKENLFLNGATINASHDYTQGVVQSASDLE